MKLDEPSPESTWLKIVIESTHRPVWGDFYGKDGNAGGSGENYLYHAGLGTLGDYTNPLRYDYYDSLGNLSTYADTHVLVPDTVAIPVPGAALLGFLGLTAAGIRRRRLA